jgi:hypothetical protein
VTLTADLDDVATAADTLRRNTEDTFRVLVATYVELVTVCDRVMRRHHLGQRELARRVGMERISQATISRALTVAERHTARRLERFIRDGSYSIQGYVDSLRAGRT